MGDESWNDLANAVLVLEHQRAKAIERAELAERTVDMLTAELLKSAEQMIELRREIAELKGRK